MSGAAALIYQVLWLRILGLVFGVTTYAATTVLASFMGGLAVGSVLAGKIADRVRNPLRWFAGAEALVGVTALLSPVLLDALHRVYRVVYVSLPDVAGAVTLARFACSFAVLLIPTALMGSTLPLVLKSSLFRETTLGSRAALLYATNTAGALLGTLAAGLVLLATIGINGSFRLAAALNLIVAVTSAWGATLIDPAGRHASQPSGVPVVPAPATTRQRLVLFVFAISGFASLAFEVIWFRALVLFAAPTSYAFTLMIAAVLAGIAAGSYLVAPLMARRADWFATLAWLEVAIACAAVASFAGLSKTYLLSRWIDPGLPAAGATQLGSLIVATLIAVFPTCVLLGIAFPIGLDLWTSGDSGPARGSRHAGERIGVFYALNLAGAIVGAPAAGFLLLPWLGSPGALVAIAATVLLSGLVLVVELARTRRVLAVLVAIAALGVFGLSAVSMRHPIDAIVANRFPGDQPWIREEGVQTTVTIHRRAQPDGPPIRIMYLNGAHQAQDSSRVVWLHRMIGILPAALHPDAREALVIGLGGGATAGALSRMPGVTIEVVELSASVARASRYFAHVNYDVLHQGNVKLVADDGRNHLLLNDRQYDVITADAIQPHFAGAANLYSAEYFRLVRRALREGGVVCQWISGGPETQYKLMMRTFLSVFPDATLWANATLLVGTKHPLRLERARFERALRQPTLKSALADVGIDSFEKLLALYTAGPEEMRRFVRDGPVLTDDRPLIEYFLMFPDRDRRANLTDLAGDVSRLVAQ
ncbi:MAG: fused MFS/spermidine synthase [Acidobacteria bacterium]|nr:fused MFS/spermidine synthase [Acidobacteriota bacterium]